MNVCVFTHAINTDAHPSVPPGWRWAVHIGGNPTRLEECLNAGWAPSPQTASIQGEAVGVAVVKALRMCGQNAVFVAARDVTYDPTPPEASGLDLLGNGRVR